MPPDAHTVHPGHGLPDGPRLRRIRQWLTANGIDPGRVAVNRPVYVLALPNGTIQGGLPWLIDVIVFHEYYQNSEGHRERNFITGDAVMVQRTVPLQIPFPAEHTTADEGAVRGEADQQAAQEAPQEVVRPAPEEGLSDPRQSPCPSGPLEGEAARNEGAAEEGPRRGHEAVSEPEEDRRPEKEVAE